MPSVDPQVETVADLVCAQKHYQRDASHLAAGAFKRTYRVTDQAGATLALKIVAGRVDAERVSREISALAGCNDPHIVRLIETGVVQHEEREWVFFIEEYLDGGTLTARMTSGCLDLPAGKRVAQCISSALLHLDARRLVHRDVKPDNIMFRASDVFDDAVLVDLGIARHLDAAALTAEGLTGPMTPAYAASEQLLAERDFIDWRCDQYSLGVVLALAMLGMHPATGTNDLNAAPAIVQRRLPPADSFLRAAEQLGLPQLIRMVQPWPAQRFARPEMLLAAWEG